MSLVRARAVSTSRVWGEAAEDQLGLLPQSAELLFTGTGGVGQGPLCCSPALCSACDTGPDSSACSGLGTAALESDPTRARVKLLFSRFSSVSHNYWLNRSKCF